MDKFTVKYIEDSYRRANQRGELSEYLFYLKLKLKTRTPYFAKKRAVTNIADLLHLSLPQTSQLLKRAVKAGYVVETVNSYRPIGYDKLFEKLGYHRDRLGRISTFRIWRLKAGVESIKSDIHYTELKHSIKKQEIALLSSAYKDLDLNTKNLSVKAMLRRQAHTNLTDKCRAVESLLGEQIWLEKLESCAYEQERSHCNPLLGLSCESISRMFGYSSSRSGYMITRQLESLELLAIRNRSYLVKFCPYEDYASSELKERGGYFYKDGGIHRVLVNKLVF